MNAAANGRCATELLVRVRVLTGMTEYEAVVYSTVGLGHFSLVAKFYAANHNSHALCAYLINQTTKQTYANASHFWSNS